MKFKCYNTKLNKMYTFEKHQIRDLFEYDTFKESNIFIDDLEEFLSEVQDENERKELEEYYKKINVYYDESEYFKAMIEFETWTSPRGIISCFIVKSIELESEV